MFGGSDGAKKEVKILKKQSEEKIEKIKNLTIQINDYEQILSNPNENLRNLEYIKYLENSFKEINVQLHITKQELDNIYASFTKNSSMKYSSMIVDMIYRSVLQRAPTTDELKLEVIQLENDTMSEEQLYYRLTKTNEAKNLVPPLKITSNLNAKEIVHRLYREILFRIPDEKAIQSYVYGIQKNEITEEQLRNLLIDSEEGKALRKNNESTN